MNLLRNLPLLVWMLFNGTARAGLGPETTLLVVNADSPLSLTVANHWLTLRPIPKTHVVWLHDIPGLGTISMDAFRERILLPVLDQMEALGIDQDIDTIVYSADFPYAVKLRKEVRSNGLKYNRYIGQSASLTSLTFFAHQARNRKVDYLAPLANHYFRRELSGPGQRLDTPLPRAATKRKEKAARLLDAGEYTEAARLLAPLVRQQPGAPALRLLLARALAGSGKTTEAMGHLNRLPQLGYRGSLAIRNLREFKALRLTPEFDRLMEELDQPRQRFEPPRGFRSHYHWQRGKLVSSNDDRYFLAASLAFTGQRGNSLPEILAYLERSARSDFSHPRGTVYLMENRNVRTETRQPWFSITCALLATIDHPCEIITREEHGEDGILPKNRRDIIGLVAGYRTFDWEKSGSTLLEGAIAEALTSYGGDFDNRVQTKLTHFLRHGASASSGAVSEPYAFAEKFPLPLLHYYYGLGYSAAEAWYQAVASPYQLILVGDPLTRPYADPLSFEFKTSGKGGSWRGTVTLEFQAHGKEPIDHFELWIDGRHIQDGENRGPFKVDSTELDDGHHRMHLVAVEKSPREGRSTQAWEFIVNNRKTSVTLGSSSLTAFFGDSFQLQGQAPNDNRVEIRQGNRVLAVTSSKQGQWSARVSTWKLGMGTVELQAVAVTGPGQGVRSKPLVLSILPPDRLQSPRGRAPEGKPFEARLIFRDKAGNRTEKRRKLKALAGRQKSLIPKRATLVSAEVSGNFRVRKPGFHQLSLRTRGPVEVRVDGNTFRKVAPADHLATVHLPLFLEPGWHSVEILPSPEGFADLQAVLAGEETPRLLGTGTRRPENKGR